MEKTMKQSWWREVLILFGIQNATLVVLALITLGLAYFFQVRTPTFIGLLGILFGAQLFGLIRKETIKHLGDARERRLFALHASLLSIGFQVVLMSIFQGFNLLNVLLQWSELSIIAKGFVLLFSFIFAFSINFLLTLVGLRRAYRLQEIEQASTSL